MPSIAKIHEKLLDRLIRLRKKNPGLYFSPRKRNNSDRLNRGYWFLGNDHYVYLNLWNGGDWKEKVNCIGFVVLDDGQNYIELSAQGCHEVVPFLEKITGVEPGFEKLANKYKWFKYFPDKDYLKNFDYFLEHFKPKVDRLIDAEKPPVITKVTALEFEKYGMDVIRRRRRQVEYGRTNKITRLSWNTNNWQYPSGWLGKSRNLDTHEGRCGFGYEEWLFDRSKLVDGYHYGFIRGFQSKINRHAGKVYNVHLYAQNNMGQYFYVGCIRDAEGISRQDSVALYQYYRERGWLNEMASSLKQVEADVTVFNQTDPELFFNVRFKLSDIEQDNDLEEIAETDDNITTDRFKLLDYRGYIDFDLTPISEDEDTDDGNFKNTGQRKRTFNGEQVYDPYHDWMQNAIVAHLRSNVKYGYKRVKIEKGRVDIKAVTHQGEWDYFEIKTDNPKRCIRNAIGQVMEYAYYPGTERAKNIIVVGDREPDENAVNYLVYIRDRFGLPVTYRFFDRETMTLSDDYPGAG
jgi:hypothetical protein